MHGKAGLIMTIKTRKLVIVVPVAVILLLANFLVLAEWLDGVGVIDWAQDVSAEYVTGTAIAVIAALLIMLPPAPLGRGAVYSRAPSCPVCDEGLRPGGRYCPACGSRV